MYCWQYVKSQIVGDFSYKLVYVVKIQLLGYI